MKTFIGNTFSRQPGLNSFTPQILYKQSKISDADERR